MLCWSWRDDHSTAGTYIVPHDGEEVPVLKCKDCGQKNFQWQEYCTRCGAELYRRRREKRDLVFIFDRPLVNR